MYKIFADDTLIYDSTLEDYKIGKGLITLETNKSGSFTFSLYPDHFYYDKFIKLKTVITVYKSNKIVFRGRILNDVTDYFNNKVITCEGELGFLQDSIIRPFNFAGTPNNLFKKLIQEHNDQVDDFKKFKIGNITVTDPNNFISRSNSEYESAISNLNSRLIEDSLGGYFYITHGEDGTDIIPTINYLADFTNVSTQKIKFGENLTDYTKTTTAEEIATAIIPLGSEVDDGKDETENKRLTIADVNDGKDYVYSEKGVELYGLIFKTVTWDDVTDASNLKRKAEEYLDILVNQNVTIELNAIDLHLIDSDIESFNVCDYIQVISEPHNFDSILLCNRQTLDLLKPENDSLLLGHNYSTFTENNVKVNSYVSSIPKKQTAINVEVAKNIASTTDKLTNEENETFNFGTLNGVKGFYTDSSRSEENFYPFLQNVPQIVAEGKVVINATSETGDFIPLEVNTAYTLISITVHKTTGAFRCYRERDIFTSFDSSKNTPVYVQFDKGSGGTGTVTFTYTTTSIEEFGVAVKPSSTTYALRYTLIKLGGGEVWNLN